MASATNKYITSFCHIKGNAKAEIVITDEMEKSVLLD